MPSQRHHELGNLFVTFDIKFPEPHWTTPETIAQLEAILPPRRDLGKVPKGHELDEVSLQDMDARQEAAAGNGMDEDEEGGGGQPNVQCAQQ